MSTDKRNILVTSAGPLETGSEHNPFVAVIPGNGITVYDTEGEERRLRGGRVSFIPAWPEGQRRGGSLPTYAVFDSPSGMVAVTIEALAMQDVIVGS